MAYLKKSKTGYQTHKGGKVFRGRGAKAKALRAVKAARSRRR